MSTGIRATLGGVGWAALAFAGVAKLIALDGVRLCVAFVVLVVAPLAIDLARERRDLGAIGAWLKRAAGWQLFASLCLAFALALQPGWLAGALTLPWVFVAAVMGAVACARVVRDGWARPIDRLSADVGLAYLVIGSLWAVADRVGIRPLGFDAPTVTWIALHFHGAGFVLPISAGLVSREMPDSRFAMRGVVGAILGVPALAAGITVTQLGGSAGFEAAAGCGLALAGASVAVLQIRAAWDARDLGVAPRASLAIAGVALFFAVALVAAVSVRSYVPLPEWAAPATARVLNGVLYAVFGLFAALGWRAAATARAASGQA